MPEVQSAAHDIVPLDDERALIQQASTDKSALAELYRRHAKQILNYVQRRVGCTAEEHMGTQHIGEKLLRFVKTASVRGERFDNSGRDTRLIARQIGGIS